MEQYKRENFTEPKPAFQLKNQNQLVNNFNPSTYRFCNDSVPTLYQRVANNQEIKSPNQLLVGAPNPKTKQQPVITPQSHDLSYWKANNMVVHSHVNDETQQDAYQDGFQITTCCGSGGKEIKETYKRGAYSLGRQGSGLVNTTCGYNPKQLQHSNLPTNYPASNCQKDRAFKEYNKNLFTQIIEPGVYSRSQINQPINSNIGISFTQQLPPTTYKQNKQGLIYTEHDPNIIEPITPPYQPQQEVNMSNIYDPRHSGYGTSYRAYTDQRLGQTRFMYDDIDSIRMPNYITRNNIDHTNFGDSYGPMKNANGNEFNSKIRALANDAFLQGTLQHRTGIMESALRKRRAEAWQQRIAPISKSNKYMSGGMSCR